MIYLKKYVFSYIRYPASYLSPNLLMDNRDFTELTQNNSFLLISDLSNNPTGSSYYDL